MVAGSVLLAALRSLGFGKVAGFLLGSTALTAGVFTASMVVIPAVSGGFTPDNYIANFIGYYFMGTIDLIWQPIASFINSGVGLFTVIINFFLTLFGSGSTWFAYYVSALVLIFFFALVVKLIMFLKNFILRWL